MTQTVGVRVRSLREDKGLSLRGLAARTGVSAPMLSQVERGETSPTLAVASKIASGLDLSLSQLLRLDDAHICIVRRAERRVTERGGHRFDELTPPLPAQRSTVTVHTLQPGAETGGPDDPPLHEPGSRETAVVETGTLDLDFDGRTYRLSTGDSVTFDADLGHRFRNPGRKATRFVAVVTAGPRGR